MTKQEVLQDIDELCGNIDDSTNTFICAAKKRDFIAMNEAKDNIGRLLVSAHQELSFLRDYINDNIKE